MSFGQQLLMVFTLMLTSKGVAGVPRASLVILLGTAASFNLLGLPVTQVPLGLYPFIDLCRQERIRRGQLRCALGHSQFQNVMRVEFVTHDVPTLIIHGSDDQIVPIDASSKMSAKIIKNAKLVIYDGAPHGLATTHKDRLNQDLLSFLKS